MKVKKEVSNVLMNKRDWHDINKEKVPENTPVMVRLYNKSYIYVETENEIYYAEDIKMAKYIKNYNSDGGQWAIMGPFPKYDASPLSQQDQLINNTIITHWSLATEQEVEDWSHRYEPTFRYKDLRIDVDEELEPMFYKAIMHGAASLARANSKAMEDPNSPERIMYTILSDIQALFDCNIYFENGEMKHKNELENTKEEEENNAVD